MNGTARLNFNRFFKHSEDQFKTFSWTEAFLFFFNQKCIGIKCTIYYFIMEVFCMLICLLEKFLFENNLDISARFGNEADTPFNIYVNPIKYSSLMWHLSKYHLIHIVYVSLSSWYVNKYFLYPPVIQLIQFLSYMGEIFYWK